MKLAPAHEIVIARAAELAAVELWRREAIAIDVARPFKLVSGVTSPIYINCRRAMSYQSTADLFVYGTRVHIESKEIEFDVVAGGETAGIPFATWVARAFNRPLVYVRKKAKAHGMAGLVEGAPVTNSRVLLVEDLITDAGSKIDFINAIEEEGASVTDVLVLFDRNQGGVASLASRNIALHAITDMETALSVASANGLVASADLAEVRRHLAR
jgi:orotate phosphoribosyltransferase